MHRMSTPKGLMSRLENGGTIVHAEGYMFEMERRGYLSFRTCAPEVVLEHPEVIEAVTEDFIHAGAEVVQAFTYYANKEKLELVGRGNDLKSINMKALEIARKLADKHGLLMAAGLCNSVRYHPDEPTLIADVKEMFEDQVDWFVEAGCDYIIGEMFSEFGEAMLALQVAKDRGKGIPCVITLTPFRSHTVDGITVPEACKRLQEAGADVVGLNCGRGPTTMLPIIKEVISACKGPVACLPVPYRTTEEYRNFQRLMNPDTGESAYFNDLTMHYCSRTEIREFAEQAKKIGVQYIGLCCGNNPSYTRIVADVYGRKPPSCKYMGENIWKALAEDKVPQNKGSARFFEHAFG